MKKVEIRISLDSQINMYTVEVNDDTIFECMSKEEIEALTVREIMKYSNDRL